MDNAGNRRRIDPIERDGLSWKKIFSHGTGWQALRTTQDTEKEKQKKQTQQSLTAGFAL